MLPSSFRSTRMIALTTGVAAALALSACADDGQPDSSSSQSASAPANSAQSIADIDCDPAPAIPTDVPTFRATQAPPATAPDVATVRMVTNCGPITFELNGAAAPQSVASFLLLGEGDFWTDSPCHRLVDGGIHVLQCGDPTGTGRGDPGYTFGIENAPADGFYPRGSIAMARTNDPDSNGSQYFIVFADTMLPTDGGGYSIFGTVTDGMDIVEYIAAAGVDGGGVEGMPAQPISILDVEIEGEAASS